MWWNASYNIALAIRYSGLFILSFIGSTIMCRDMAYAAYPSFQKSKNSNSNCYYCSCSEFHLFYLAVDEWYYSLIVFLKKQANLQYDSKWA